jgi:hypothetical protein
MGAHVAEGHPRDLGPLPVIGAAWVAAHVRISPSTAIATTASALPKTLIRIHLVLSLSERTP